MALTEGKHAGEFLVSKANGSRSVTTGTVVSGQNLEAGTVVGVITASGKYAIYDAGASDGTESVAGILYDNVNATDGDIDGQVVYVRDAEVRESDLTYFDGATAGEITTANTELEALGIIVR
jgi:hypothetical protein